MTTHLHTFKPAAPMSEPLALAPEEPGPWRHRVWTTRYARWMLSAFSAALVVGLLLAFYNVVSQAAVVSAVHQQALVAHAQGTWRCKRLPNATERQDCLLAIPKLLANGDIATAQVSR
jgi:hypothetical protein